MDIKWISVKESVPEKGAYFIGYGEGVVRPCERSRHDYEGGYPRFYDLTCHTDHCQTLNVDYWMYFPTAPEIKD